MGLQGISHFQMHSRRKFLANCSVAATALAVVPLSAMSSPALTECGLQPLEKIGYLALARQVKSVFRVHPQSGQPVALTLLKAPLAPAIHSAPSRPPAPDADNEKFSLIFSGPKDVVLASAIHLFEHDQLGRFEMYVGQIGTLDPHSHHYETVFNRPAPAAPRKFA